MSTVVFLLTLLLKVLYPTVFNFVREIFLIYFVDIKEVPSLQVLCIEAIANNKALRQDRENLPAHLNDLISKREKAHPNTILCKIVDKLETLYNL